MGDQIDTHRVAGGGDCFGTATLACLSMDRSGETPHGRVGSNRRSHGAWPGHGVVTPIKSGAKMGQDGPPVDLNAQRAPNRSGIPCTFCRSTAGRSINIEADSKAKERSHRRRPTTTRTGSMCVWSMIRFFLFSFVSSSCVGCARHTQHQLPLLSSNAAAAKPAPRTTAGRRPHGTQERHWQKKRLGGPTRPIFVRPL